MIAMWIPNDDCYQPCDYRSGTTLRLDAFCNHYSLAVAQARYGSWMF